ncbi:enoyl-CoA hydratase/isomerase family protein [Subtercola endophyticus]|uniref:enoyl-CoA hydratase/isomerase family protein n=1 Tax=Subtercola endophyticus TaxID=2895559 RepID=UPI001E2D0BAF|nr:enoyl-CoA hydratase/isomerase family protein [Subtercola endophyticus]UFS58331.1 enoyl-CoA hydratase/isomerase family protein [Subtercola endophyticus]
MDITIDNWIGIIEVDDFSPLNRGDIAFTTALRNAVVDLSDNDFVKVIVLRSRGDFAPAQLAPDPDPALIFTDWSRTVSGASALYQSMTFSKKVILTEVAGECSGAGSLLVLSSDLTVAAHDATFASPFAEHPEANFVLAALTIRLNRAKAWLIRDYAIDAAQADAFGLVNRVVDRDRLASAALDMAASAALMPLDGVVMTKMLQQAVLDASGVGREFDMASFYSAGLLVSHGETHE